MKVVILCGGLGARLREETEYRPKPLVEIGGKPILWHIMRLFAHHGWNEFVLALGNRGRMIREYFLYYKAFSHDCTIRLARPNEITHHEADSEPEMTVTLVDTGAETMTGGRIKRVQKHIADELFMVTYGDGVADLDIRNLIAFHRSHGKKATVTAVRPTSRFGALDLASNGRVRAFAEKPRLEGWSSCGFFVFHRSVFDELDGDACVLEREPLERLAAAGELVAFQHEGFFFAMDTYREYLELNELWNTSRAPWKVWP